MHATNAGHPGRRRASNASGKPISSPPGNTAGGQHRETHAPREAAYRPGCSVVRAERHYHRRCLVSGRGVFRRNPAGREGTLLSVTPLQA